MIKRAMLAALFAASILAVNAHAQEPTPSPDPAQDPDSPTPVTTLVPASGRSFVFTVLDTEGKPVADGTRLSFINADIPPPLTEEELEEARTREPCTTATVSDGRAELQAQFNSDCPEGSRVSVLISIPEGWITAGVHCDAQDMGACPQASRCGERDCQPWLDQWSRAEAGDSPLKFTVQAIGPQEGGEGEHPIAPPSTGDALLVDSAEEGSPGWILLAIGAAVFLAVSSLGLAVIRNKQGDPS